MSATVDRAATFDGRVVPFQQRGHQSNVCSPPRGACAREAFVDAGLELFEDTEELAT